MSRLQWLEAELASLAAADLLREPLKRAESAPEGLIDVCSNDYLGYAADPVSRETLPDSVLPGAGASRLISGSTPAHDALEQALAAWVGCEASLLLSSGYLANVSTIGGLVGEGDVVLSDRLNHASLVDGCRLSGARTLVYPHLDLDVLREQLRGARGFRRRLLVTESYFSMDGDGPNIVQLLDMCNEFDTMLLLDEAHALGVFGPRGAGRAAQAGVLPDVLVGTFGKALGTQGAFVAGRAQLKQWLWNRCRGFVFSTAVSPLLSGITAARLQRAQAADAARLHLSQLCGSFEARLREAGIALPKGRFGPIFPVVLGSAPRAIAAAAQLRAAGFAVQPIRPPTVPEGESRLRITLNARLTEADVTHLAEELAKL